MTDETLRKANELSNRIQELIARKAKWEKATPEEIRSGGGGWEIRFGFAPTPVGECLVAQAPRGVCFAAFVTREAGGRPGALAALGREWPAARRVRDDRVAAAIADAMFRASPRRRGPLRLLVRASAFELRVWETLAAVPEGSLVSYGELARAIGRARAARAVASAVARNPVAVAIPCHRVVRATGMTGGYRWGVPRKVSLLAREAARPRAGAPAPDQSSN